LKRLKKQTWNKPGNSLNREYPSKNKPRNKPDSSANRPLPVVTRFGGRVAMALPPSFPFLTTNTGRCAAAPADLTAEGNMAKLVLGQPSAISHQLSASWRGV